MINQYQMRLAQKPRGFHLVTNEIMGGVPTLPDSGLMNVFIMHTSAGLSINENADPSVRVDFESIFNRMVPENEPYYTHTFEGSDDMPSHVKSSLVGSSVTIPITDGGLNLGTWQGIYLCEFRNSGGRRKVVVTVYS